MVSIFYAILTLPIVGKEDSAMGKVHKDIRLQIRREYMNGLKDYEIAKKLNINFVDVVRVLNPNY